MLQRVPATIMTSDCLGLPRGTIPNLSMSYRGAMTCINSIEQQAKPKDIGQSEPVLAQLTTLSKLANTNPLSFSSSVTIFMAESCFLLELITLAGKPVTSLVIPIPMPPSSIHI